MYKVVSVETMLEIEAASDAGGHSYATMMELAGQSVARRALDIIAQISTQSDEPARVTVLVGKGNNGGDGLVVGRVIAENSSAQVRFYLTEKRGDDDPNFKAVKDAGLFIADAEDDQRFRVLTNMVASAHIIIDAVFGIGLTPPLRDDATKFMRAVNQALDLDEQPADAPRIVPLVPDSQLNQRPPLPYIIAVDCPSGLDANTGEIDKNALSAHETVTFIAAKPGLFNFPGAEAVGNLIISTIGVDPKIDGLKNEQRTVVAAETVRALLPARPDGSHKGTFGKTLLVAGSVNYTGAAGLAALGAYRIGAGLVTVAAPGPVVSALAAHMLEATWILLAHDMGVIAEGAADVIREESVAYDSLLIGPGLGRENTTRDMLVKLLENITLSKPAKKRSIGFIHQHDDKPRPDNQENSNITLPPLVIDADGLNLLAELDNWWERLPENTILTPHPGEMSRLANLETAEIQANRWQVAAEKAAEWRVVLVLKGAHTLIAAPDGRVSVLPFKTSALAKAGTGDVLAGMIAGLLAQGLHAYDAAVVGGYLHGLAGQLLTQPERFDDGRSILASDVATYGLPQALQLLAGG